MIGDPIEDYDRAMEYLNTNDPEYAERKIFVRLARGWAKVLSLIVTSGRR